MQGKIFAIGLTVIIGCLGVADAQALTVAERASAARKTAAENPFCTALPRFYWEIGDRNGALVSGSKGTSAPLATTELAIASASKWLWGAYIAQYRQGAVTADDIQALTMKTGYVNWIGCRPGQTVGECFQRFRNDKYTPAEDGRFTYKGSHFQKQAVDLGLSGLGNEQLANEMRKYLGAEIQFSFEVPSPAGGAKTSAAEYAKFLRKILSGKLAIAELLGANATCTYTGATDSGSGRQHCSTSASSPVENEAWAYSLGHWLEVDPQAGDGAFSSPGAFGFYPWIDRSKTWYGVLSRHQFSAGAYWDSVRCGREIRKSWLRGAAQ